MRSILRLCICLFVAVAISGCAGYRLGPPNGESSGIRTIQIKPFANKTLEPRLSDYVMISLRKNLAQDDTYRIDTHDDGDIILSGVILSYDRNNLSVQPNDVLTVLDYQISLTVKVTATQRNTGKVILEKNVIGRTILRAGADLSSAERESVPILTDDFAKKTTSLLVDGIW